MVNIRHPSKISKKLIQVLWHLAYAMLSVAKFLNIMELLVSCMAFISNASSSCWALNTYMLYSRSIVVLFSILISISGAHFLSEMIFRLFAGIPNKHHMWKWGMVKGSTHNNLHHGILIGSFPCAHPWITYIHIWVYENSTQRKWRIAQLEGCIS